MKTFQYGPICGGVTSLHVTPPSRVVWITPSSVPIQMRLTTIGDGPMV